VNHECRPYTRWRMHYVLFCFLFQALLITLGLLKKLLFNYGRTYKQEVKMRSGARNFFPRIAVFLCVSAFLSTAAYADNGPSLLNSRVLEQMNILAMEKKSRTGAQKKLNSQFVYALKKRRGELNIPGFKPAVKIDSDDTTLVDIKARVSHQLLTTIEGLGGEIINSFEHYNSIRARFPLEKMELLAQDPDIFFIRPATRPIFNKNNTSEGDVAHTAAQARTNFGVDGTGVKVGVLSDGVDSLATVQGSGDLPGITILPSAGGSGTEGTAMLEVAYDLAPGAQLFFATALGGEANFATNILALKNAGCKVVVDDAVYATESPFQDDIISQAVNTVTSQGVFYFSSAANFGNLNDGESGVWEGDFVSTTPHPYGFLCYYTLHDFVGDGHLTNEITSSSNEAVKSYTLFWSDPLGDSSGGSSNDYALFILEKDESGVYMFSDDIQDGYPYIDPYEEIQTGEDLTGYKVVIANWDGAGLDRFIYFSTNGGRLEHGTSGHIRGHAAAANAFAVAAVDASSMTSPFTGSESVEPISSDGPRRVFYTEDGTELTPGNLLSTGGVVRKKPDIAAADNVLTATPGYNPLNATSASASHAAAIAALMLSAKPDLTIGRARAIFRKTALDIEATGWDRDSGYGIIMADKVLNALTSSWFNPALPLLLLE